MLYVCVCVLVCLFVCVFVCTVCIAIVCVVCMHGHVVCVCTCMYCVYVLGICDTAHFVYHVSLQKYGSIRYCITISIVRIMSLKTQAVVK